MAEAKTVHFVGIGGIGMSGIAEILGRSGYKIHGSDLRQNIETERLKGLGAIIFEGHKPENVKDADVVVFSSAVSPNNPEILEAKRKHIPVLSRTEMLAELMRKKHSIVVAGAHGKTTTSAMITTMLLECGYDPTAVIGGRLKRIASNAKFGTDNWFVAESDESDGSFLRLLPTVSVITNIDREHMDHYGSYARLEQAFVEFANRVPFDGKVIICLDDRGSREVVPKIERPIFTYGIEEDADLKAIDIELSDSGTSFVIYHHNEKIGGVHLTVLGLHNILNCLGAAAVGLHLGIHPDQICKSLGAFSGIDRRMDLKGEVKGIRVVDDYAHHPTEIAATLKVLRIYSKGRGRIKVLFQPHRYSRLGDLWERFVEVFDLVDEVIVTPVYAASEKSIIGIDSPTLVSSISKRGKTQTRYSTSIEEGVSILCENVNPGDLLVTMGAGDITKAASIILKRLGELHENRKGNQ